MPFVCEMVDLMTLLFLCACLLSSMGDVNQSSRTPVAALFLMVRDVLDPLAVPVCLSCKDFAAI